MTAHPYHERPEGHLKLGPQHRCASTRMPCLACLGGTLGGSRKLFRGLMGAGAPAEREAYRHGALQ